MSIMCSLFAAELFNSRFRCWCRKRFAGIRGISLTKTFRYGKKVMLMITVKVSVTADSFKYALSVNPPYKEAKRALKQTKSQNAAP